MCPNRQTDKLIRTEEPIPGAGGGADLIAQLRPYLRHCGHEYRRPWRIDSRKLLDYLLVYIASGHGTFEVAGITTRAEPGDLFWIPPDTPHAMDSDSPCMELAYVHFDLIYQPGRSHWDFSIPGGMLDLGELSALMHEPLPDARLSGLCGRLHNYNNERIGHLLKEISAEAVRAQPYGSLRTSGLLLEVVAEILRGQQGMSQGISAHIPILEEAAATIQHQCHTPVSIDRVARQHGFSPSHFRQLFRKHYNCPPRSYLRQARIGKACRLMMASSKTLSEIAEEVGFNSVHSLSKAFREEEGITPSEYRRAGQTYTHVSGRHTAYPR